MNKEEYHKYLTDRIAETDKVIIALSDAQDMPAVMPVSSLSCSLTSWIDSSMISTILIMREV